MLNMKMAVRLWAAAIFLLTALVISENTAVAIGECPPVGANTDCATVITIEDTGLSIVHTGRGPYDQIEDTLVGVVNHKTTYLTSIELVSGLPIFQFDGDGICGLDPLLNNQPFSTRPNGCPFGPTTYEGLGVEFTNISADFKRGIVKFSPGSTPPGIPPGGSAYFSLEENINADPNACKNGINFSLATSIINSSRGPTIMNATFTPNGGVSLSTAAQNCGFDRFNWISEISVPAPVPFWKGTKTEANRLLADTFYNDPVQGGYSYDPSWNSFPYYWDASNSDTNPDPNLNHNLSIHTTPTILSFRDNPTDACLSDPAGTLNRRLGGTSTTNLECNVPTTPPPTNAVLAGTDKTLIFKTRLVGVRNNSPLTPVELGILFKWESAFNGLVGGISRTANLVDADPGIGTGGIAVTEVQGVTNYEYNGIAVTTVNGTPIAPAIAVSATPKKLWPPNKFMVPVTVSGTMTDTGGSGVNPNTAAYVVLDEYGLVQPKGKVTLSANGSYSFPIELQASRKGDDIDGRQYHITVSVEDNVGNKGSSSTLVIVPHDQRSDPKH